MSSFTYIFPFFSGVLSWLESLAAVGNLANLALYVLGAIGLGTLAKRRGIRNWGLAWVPIGDRWVLGSIADEYQRRTRGKDTKYRRLLLLLSLVSLVLLLAWVVAAVIGMVQVFLQGNASILDHPSDLVSAILSTFGFLLLLLPVLLLIALASRILYYIALYRAFCSCSPDNATLFLVLSIFFPFLSDIFLFACRKQGGDSAGSSPSESTDYPSDIPHPAEPTIVSNTTQEDTYRE